MDSLTSMWPPATTKKCRSFRRFCRIFSSFQGVYRISGGVACLLPTALNGKFRTKIQLSTARQMKRLFNAIPYAFQCISEISPDTFKGHLDKWLRTIPDTPKIGNYGASVPAESNSLCDQAKQVGQAGDPNCG